MTASGLLTGLATALALAPLVQPVGNLVFHYLGGTLLLVGIYLALENRHLGMLKVSWSSRSKSFEGAQSLGFIILGVILILLAGISRPQG